MAEVVRNETKVYWTVQLGHMFVTNAGFIGYGNRLSQVEMSVSEAAAKWFDDENLAKYVAKEVGGRATKITRNLVVTETREDFTDEPAR